MARRASTSSTAGPSVRATSISTAAAMVCSVAITVALGGPDVPGHDAPGPVAVEAPALGLGGDLGRPLRVDGHCFLGHAGDGPLAQAARGPVVGHDAVAETHGFPGRRHPADHGGGV